MEDASIAKTQNEVIIAAEVMACYEAGRFWVRGLPPLAEKQEPAKDGAPWRFGHVEIVTG